MFIHASLCTLCVEELRGKFLLLGLSASATIPCAEKRHDHDLIYACRKPPHQHSPHHAVNCGIATQIQQLRSRSDGYKALYTIMRFRNRLLTWLSVAPWLSAARALPTSQTPVISDSNGNNRTISLQLFNELEELSRIVDISYCVGTTGIQKPFLCASRCQEFPEFELVTVSSPSSWGFVSRC